MHLKQFEVYQKQRVMDEYERKPVLEYEMDVNFDDIFMDESVV